MPCPTPHSHCPSHPGCFLGPYHLPSILPSHAHVPALQVLNILISPPPMNLHTLSPETLGECSWWLSQGWSQSKSTASECGLPPRCPVLTAIAAGLQISFLHHINAVCPLVQWLLPSYSIWACRSQGKPEKTWELRHQKNYFPLRCLLFNHCQNHRYHQELRKLLTCN